MIEIIYKGATRPSMKFGVPLIPLLVIVPPGFVAGMWLSTLVDWRFAPPIFGGITAAYVWMRFVTNRDDQRLMQMLLNLKLRVRNRNSSLRRGTRSYAPVAYRGGSHVWRR